MRRSTIRRYIIGAAPPPREKGVRARAGRGLGDSLYLRPICEHIKRAGEQVIALTDYPEVFVGAAIPTQPFDKRTANLVAHYTKGKSTPHTTQFEDCCTMAGVPTDLPFKIDWRPCSPDKVKAVRARARGRPLVLIHGGRAPMNRTDGYGMEIVPAPHAFRAAVAEMRDCYRVLVGKVEQLYTIEHDENLSGQTSILDLLDLAHGCDKVVAQCSFAVPLAEVFDKPLLAIWSAKGLESPKEFVRAIRPEKVFTRGARDHFIMDDWHLDKIRESARAFRDL